MQTKRNIVCIVSMEEMLTYGVLLLLDLNLGAVLESPLDNVGLLGGTLDVLRGLKGRPELGEVLDLDQVPNGRERGADDGRLADGGGGGDGRHGECFFGGLLEGVWVCVVGIEEKKVCCGVFYAKASVCCCWICNELALCACPARGSHLLANITARS
jgi:hypothetical protein